MLCLSDFNFPCPSKFMRHLVYTILMLLILANSVLFSQTQDSIHLNSTDTTFVYKPQMVRNNAYVEIGGAGLLGAISYERILGEFLCVRIALPNLGVIFPSQPSYLFIPTIASVSCLLGEAEYKFELGVGGWFFSQLHPFGIIGYRYQPKDGGFMFRASFTPMEIPSLFHGEPSSIIPWGGVSLGINF
jgi:hypothetical protein